MNAHCCQICLRNLTDPTSIANGIGPECATTYARGIQAAGSSFESVERLASYNDSEINKRIKYAQRAIGKGRRDHAALFLSQAEGFARFIDANRDSGYRTHADTGLQGIAA